MLTEQLLEAADTLTALRNALAESKYAVIGDMVVRAVSIKIL